jgi:hypothetical protein
MMSMWLFPELRVPVLVIFEVMDKEPTLLRIAIMYSFLSVIGYLLSRKVWWCGLLVIPIVSLFALGDLAELHDPFVGPAIVREAGLLHVVLWHAFILAGFGVPILTAALKTKKLSRDATASN